jgi:hypothetical protein
MLVASSLPSALGLMTAGCMLTLESRGRKLHPAASSAVKANSSNAGYR